MALSVRTMLVLVLLASVLVAVTMALLTGGSAENLGVVAVDGEERGGMARGLL